MTVATRRILFCLLALVLAACRSGEKGAPAPVSAPTSASSPDPSPPPPSPGPASAPAGGFQSPPRPLAAPAFFPPLEMVPRLKPGVVLPVAVEAVEHGQTYWAVYLVVAVSAGRTSVPGLDEAVRRVRASGVPIGGYGGLCDEGAREALADVGNVDSVSALYFRTEGEARQFAGELDPPPVRVVKVRTSCLD